MTPILKIQKLQGFVPYKTGFKPAYYFRIRAANGEIVLQSEGYNTKRAREKTVKLLLSATFKLATKDAPKVN